MSVHDIRGKESYRILATLPLPEAAVIIDVRQGEASETSLIDYLRVDLEELTMEMRLQEVPRWRHLAECIDFIHLKVIMPYANLTESSKFELTTRGNKQIGIDGKDDLAYTLGREYVDRVRNYRLRAIKDNSEFAERADPDQPTVRVFFLTDMQEPESLLRAATYARWLKEWVEETHGPRRFSRDEPLHIIAVCMNAGVSLQKDVLLQSFGQQPDTAIDTVLLLQQYSDDEAYIGGGAQTYQAELILYILLLHWPQPFWKTIDDANKPGTLLIKGAMILPWPTYTLGTASLEHSGRWAARWLDYGVAAKLLETLQDTKKVNQEDQLPRNIQQWLRHWWQEIQETVPDSMIFSIEELEVFSRIEKLLATAPLLRSPLASSLEVLTIFSSQVSELYTGTSGMTLQQALDCAPSILDQFQWTYAHTGESNGSDLDQIDESYKQLARLYTRIMRFVPSHFQGAEGALPRAIRQLSALSVSINEIRAIEQQPPELSSCRSEFEKQVQKAREELQSKIKTWRLPLVGRFLRSTMISLLVVILVGMIVLFGVNWQAVVLYLSSSLSSIFPGLQQDLVMLGIKGLLVLLLIGSEILYLALRNRSLQSERQIIHKKLCEIIRADATRVRSVIAARVALALLQSSDLYTPGARTSPYEQRLRDLGRHLKGVQQLAAHQQKLADERLHLVLDQKSNQSRHLSRLPGLNNRQDILAWQKLEDAFLQSCKELTTGSAQSDLLAELLLRRLGTEAATTILVDVRNKQPQRDEDRGEEDFQALSTLLVSIFLTLEIAGPPVGEVKPLLDQYVALKNRYLSGPTMLSSDVLDLQDIVKGTMLEQVMQGRADARLSVQQDQSNDFVLAAWVGSQRIGNPLLMPIFELNDVLDRLAERKMSVAQALEKLRGRSTLLGYPDEIAGNDFFSFLLPAGEVGETFLRTLDLVQAAQIHCEFFPDREKLVYFQIHRIHQLLPEVSSSTRKKPDQQE